MGNHHNLPFDFNLVAAMTTSHWRWPAHAGPLVAVGILGLCGVGPLAYLFYRDWRLRRNFHRYFESDDALPKPSVTQASRQPLLKNEPEKHFEDPESTAEGAHTDVKQGPLPGPTLSARRVGAPVAPVGSMALTAMGVVNIQADDELGEVFVDGAYVGNTPARIPLVHGLHRVKIKRAGYESYYKEFYVWAGGELHLRAVLKPIDSRNERG